MFQLQTIKLNAPIHIQMQIVARSVAFAPNRFYMMVCTKTHRRRVIWFQRVFLPIDPHSPRFVSLYVCVCVSLRKHTNFAPNRETNHTYSAAHQTISATRCSFLIQVQFAARNSFRVLSHQSAFANGARRVKLSHIFRVNFVSLGFSPPPTQGSQWLYI